MLKAVFGGLPRIAGTQLRRVLPRIGKHRYVAGPSGVLMLPVANSSKILAHSTLRRFIKTSRVVFLIICSLHAKANTPGEFVPKKEHWKNPRGFSIPDPESKAVVVFLHGSFIEKLDDKCDPNGDASGFSVPEVVRQLAGAEVAGLEVVVYAPCDGKATAMGEPLKIDQRVTAIEETLGELGRAGVDPSRIVLVGHSAGGWAALLHEKRHPGSVNSVIAFAPAFAGEKRGRPDVWQRRHDEQAAEIGSADRIPALVFSFDNDAYNTPGDLRFLSQINGTTLLQMPDKAIAGVACDIPFFASSHAHAYRKCFNDTQANVLLEFLQKQLYRHNAPLPAAHDDSIATTDDAHVSARLKVSLGEKPKR
jgi:pimeloyl-ACP methyl ester carboxylesterase